MVDKLLIRNANHWSERFSAIHKRIEEQFEDAGINKFSSKGVTTESNDFVGLIDWTLTNLLEFASYHFPFLSDGLTENDSPNGTKYKFLPLNLDSNNALRSKYGLNHPVGDYILGNTLQKFTQDWTVLTFARTQHIQFREQSEDALNTAILLAASGLEMFSSYLPLRDSNPTPVIPFFRPSANIRIAPYIENPVIGLPLDAMTYPPAMMAIAHEIGHYLYWRGRISSEDPNTNQLVQKSIWKEIEDNSGRFPPDITHWIEEVFSDLIGILIGGPIAAFSFQNLLLTARPDIFISDNGRHPIPAIRGFLHEHIVRKILRRENAADALKRRWMKFAFPSHANNLYLMTKYEKLIQLVEELTRLNGIQCLVQSAIDSSQSQFQWFDENLDNDLQTTYEKLAFDETFTQNLKDDLELKLSSGDNGRFIAPERHRNNTLIEETTNFFLKRQQAIQLQILSSEFSSSKEAIQDRRRGLWQKAIEDHDIMSGLPIADTQALTGPAPSMDGMQGTISSEGTEDETHRIAELKPEVWLRLVEFGGWTTGDGGSSGVGGQPIM